MVTDACRMRKRALPHVQAAVANLAISVLRLLGTANLARTVDNLRLHPSSGGSGDTLERRGRIGGLRCACSQKSTRGTGPRTLGTAQSEALLTRP